MKTKAAKVLDPVLKPALPSGRGAKDAILALRLAPAVKEWIEGELDKLGVEPRHRAHFYRGAILSAIGNVKRARDPAWRHFLEAVQPAARKHLGAALEMGGPGAIEHLGYDGPTVAF